MVVQNKKRLTQALVLITAMALMGCQPKQSAEQKVENQTKPTSTEAQQVQAQQNHWIEAKTVILKPTQSRVCDEEGCTDYAFQTVETNQKWINDYFRDRIKKADPVAFQAETAASKVLKEKTLREQDINQISTVIRYVGQNQQLATFEYMSFTYSAGSAHGLYHKEYVNFDLNKKKRISLQDLVVNGAEEKLKQALYDSNSMWLEDHSIESSKFQVSDNFYYGVNGIVFVYPLYELASYAEGMSELTLPYHSTHTLIKAEYLPNLPKYEGNE